MGSVCFRWRTIGSKTVKKIPWEKEARKGNSRSPLIRQLLDKAKVEGRRKDDVWMIRTFAKMVVEELKTKLKESQEKIDTFLMEEYNPQHSIVAQAAGEYHANKTSLDVFKRNFLVPLVKIEIQYEDMMDIQEQYKTNIANIESVLREQESTQIQEDWADTYAILFAGGMFDQEDVRQDFEGDEEEADSAIQSMRESRKEHQARRRGNATVGTREEDILTRLEQRYALPTVPAHAPGSGPFPGGKPRTVKRPQVVPVAAEVLSGIVAKNTESLHQISEQRLLNDVPSDEYQGGEQEDAAHDEPLNEEEIEAAFEKEQEETQAIAMQPLRRKKVPILVSASPNANGQRS